MTVLDTEARAAVAESLRDVFSDDSARDLAARLDELGWDEVVNEDPATATTMLFVEQGRALASTSLLDDVVVGALDPALTGHGVLYPSFASVGAGVLLGPVDDLEHVVVPDARGVRSVAASALELRPLGGFDRHSAWQVVVGALPDGERVAGDWVAAEAAGRRAVSAEIIGVCRAALDLAVQYTRDRRQYGRPLGSFQAVRHQLAESYAAIESAASALSAAWTVSADPALAPWAARSAKAKAGSAQDVVLRRTVQVLGAMGLTEEGPMHRFVERGATLDQLLGSHGQLVEQTGRDLLTGTPAHPVVQIWEDTP